MMTDLAHTGTLISAESAGNPFSCRCDGGQGVAILLFRIGAHASDSDDLLVFLDALLQLPK
jgi:hypothetical protein